MSKDMLEGNRVGKGRIQWEISGERESVFWNSELEKAVAEKKAAFKD